MQNNQATAVPRPGGHLIEQKDIKKTISLFIKNWYVFALLIALGVGFAVLFLYKSTKYYGATTTILLKKQDNALENAFKGSLKNESEKIESANEILLLSSRRLIGEAIKKLNLEISYYIEGRIKTVEVYNGTPFIIEGRLIDPTLYNKPFNIQVNSNNTCRIWLSEEHGDFNKSVSYGQAVQSSRFSFTVIANEEVLKGNNTLNNVKYKFVFNEKQDLISRYRKALKFTQEKDASAIIAEVEDIVQDRAVDFLKALTEIYIENSISTKKEVNEKTVDYLEDELKVVTSNLGQVSIMAAQQKSQTGIITEGVADAKLQQQMQLQSELSKKQVEYENIERLNELLNNEGEDVSAISSILMTQNNIGLSSILNELQQKIQLKQTYDLQYTPASPQVKEVERQIGNLKAQMTTNVITIRRSLVTQINSLKSQIANLGGAISNIPEAERTIQNITRNQALTERMYTFLMETRTQTLMAKAAIVPDRIILEPAIAQGLIRPIPMKVFVSGIGIGLALSLLTIFFRSIYYNYVTSRDDLKELTTLPILGVIAKTKEAEKEYMLVDKHPQSIASEAFRVIRSNFNHYGPKEGCKIAMFTSTVASEGKTFCAVNTGTILAKSKKKVILLDLDLHKPKQANAFNMQNDTGVTTFLSGKANLKSVIKESSVPNLDVMLSGPRVPNASELLLDPALDMMINQLKQQYDYILFDTAPVGLISDALELMKYADLTMFVMKANYSKKDFIEVAHHVAEKKDSKGFGIILNAVSQKNITAGYGGGYYK